MGEINPINVLPRWAAAQDLDIERPLIEQLYKQKTLPELTTTLNSERKLKATYVLQAL